MPRPKMVTENDLRILRLFGKYSVLSTNALSEIITDVSKNYVKKRTYQLIERGYIKRDGYNLTLTIKGAREIGLDSVPVVKEYNVHKKIAVNEALISLSEHLNVYSSKEIKELCLIPTTFRIGGGVEKDGIYAVYALPKKTTQKLVKDIKNEINKLRHYNIKKAIVFCPSKESYDAFDPDNPCEGIDELLLLPYPLGIDWFVRKDNLCEIIKEPLKPADRTFADYIAGNNTYFSYLVTNDIVKINRIKLFYDQVIQYEKSKSITAVILKDQQSHFRKIFKNYPELKYFML
ncbi:hypothetical protein SAMN02745133_01965 [Desulforamulus putei DSM 12395]|uniref:Uncharacterized protein n=1 Tax=Desulforamulus putei DSM 12395 TaxID=1121429 RepID=A0A1M4ZDT2_9FIRM|nr:hypothetical protein [Desulforamulus putei]SHF16128.1 hypothetical protein SAMN02745133_01965 [Desulforamulus putei DSM 12395]